VKLVLKRRPRIGKTRFLAGSLAANEKPVDAAVRELHEETGLNLTPDDLTLVSDAPVRVALPEGQQLVYVYSASVPVLFVTRHLLTLAHVEHAVTAQSYPTVTKDSKNIQRTTEVLLNHITGMGR
jgi:8-oxo-dGTP pyrophosphatase MutT (NUDIX family)